MFYCEECRRENNWPGFITTSYGPCEMCGKTTACYDLKPPVRIDMREKKDDSKPSKRLS